MTAIRNVLFILADQWRADCLSAVGHPVVRTPHLDALAADGALFLNHFAQASPCGPSRASILTGMYLHNHRSVRNWVPLDSRFTNIALEVRRLGYEPALIGYTDTSLDPRGRDPADPALFTYESVLPGFVPFLRLPEDPVPWNAHLRRLGYDVPMRGRPEHVGRTASEVDAERGPSFAPAIYQAEHSDTAFVTDKAIEFIDMQQGRPWFLHLVHLRPHPPWVAPAPYNAMYPPSASPPFCRAATREHEARQHPYLAWHLGRERQAAEMAPEHLRQTRATYWGLISEVDDQIGRLVEHLRSAGLYDTTLIVFSSDHGEMLGDHWCLGKDGYFDQAFRVPLIIRAPGERFAPGRRIEAFSESVDIMPTILSLLGATPPIQCDGASLVPWLRGESPAAWRSEVHWEFDFRDVTGGASERALGLALDACSLAVIRDHRYKYVHFAGLPPLFFDLGADPHELDNRASDPAFAPLVLAYAQKMISWRMTGDERTLTGVQLTPKGAVARPGRMPQR